MSHFKKKMLLVDCHTSRKRERGLQSVAERADGLIGCDLQLKYENNQVGIAYKDHKLSA